MGELKILEHTGPYRTIEDHTGTKGPFMTIRDHMEPHRTIGAHRGPYGTIEDNWVP